MTLGEGLSSPAILVIGDVSRAVNAVEARAAGRAGGNDPTGRASLSPRQQAARAG